MVFLHPGKTLVFISHPLSILESIKDHFLQSCGSVRIFFFNLWHVMWSKAFWKFMCTVPFVHAIELQQAREAGHPFTLAMLTLIQ